MSEEEFRKEFCKLAKAMLKLADERMAGGKSMLSVGLWKDIVSVSIATKKADEDSFDIHDSFWFDPQQENPVFNE